MLARIGKQVESRPRVQIDGTWHQVCVLSFSRGQLLVLSVIQVVSFESAFLCIDERRDMRTSARHLIAAFARTESKVLVEVFLLEKPVSGSILQILLPDSKSLPFEDRLRSPNSDGAFASTPVLKAQHSVSFDTVLRYL